MQEYKSNSHKSKETVNTTEEKKVEKVISGSAKTKQNNGRKLANIFISEDAANVKSYVFMDVLVPAIKKAISDIVTDGIDMILYGSTGGRSKSKSSGKVSYRDYYNDRGSDRREGRYGGGSTRSRFDQDDIYFDNRGDAEMVRKHMLDVSYEYGMVRVADMYEFAGLAAPYTANNYGWMGLREIEIGRSRDGFYLKLPNAMLID